MRRSVVILALLCSCLAKAQFSFSPSTTLIKTQVLDTMTYDSISITNNSSSTLSLDWELISADSIAGSYFDFCASGNCYLGIPDTGSFPDISPTQYGYIGMHFWTGNTPVTCVAKVRVFDQNNPAISDTVTFILNAGINGIGNLTNSDIRPLIYPNPSSGTFRIMSLKNGVNSVSVFDNMGTKLFSAQNSTNMVDLTSFPAGIYFLEISTLEGLTYQQVIVQK